MKSLAAIVLALMVSVPHLTFAQNEEIQLWPSPAPDTEKRQDAERWDDKKQLYNVFQPRLVAFLPEQRDTNTPAIIVCPGGGYRFLVMEKEGYKIARWLKTNGIAAFVLVYRLDPSEALRDAQRAVSLLRSEAKKFSINGSKIGMIGFSAGANLCANLATHFQKVDVTDSIDSISSRPDFWIGVYGEYVPDEENKGAHPSFSSLRPFSELITADTPPAFLVHAGDDPRVPALESVHLYEALRKHGVPAELHVYERGSHGFALEEDRGEAVTSTVMSWSRRCLEWLRVRGILTQPGK
jgi:acetyl esterase/lipase